MMSRGRDAGERTTAIRRRWRGRSSVLLTAAMLALAVGCAAKQRIPLDLQPSPAEIFVDGKRVKGDPSELELRVDRDHKIFIKSEGYRSELVVLRSVDVEGEDTLEPAAVAVRLSPLTRTRQDVEIGVDE